MIARQARLLWPLGRPGTSAPGGAHSPRTRGTSPCAHRAQRRLASRRPCRRSTGPAKGKGELNSTLPCKTNFTKIVFFFSKTFAKFSKLFRCFLNVLICSGHAGPNMHETNCRGAGDLLVVKVSALYDLWRSKKHRKTKIMIFAIFGLRQPPSASVSLRRSP